MNLLWTSSRQVLTAFTFALLLPAVSAFGGVIRGFDQPGPLRLGQTTANYFAINRDGLGHFLIGPYFSAQAGNVTVLSLTNTDGLNGKAVKLRFRGAGNGDLLHSLTVLLAPNDVWNAAVSADAVTGIAQLSSSDSTCTFPTLTNGAVQHFSTSRLSAGLTSAQMASHSREGYIEVITMADIPVLGSVAIAPGSLLQSIQQTVKQSRDCNASAVLNSQFNAQTETEAATLGYATPTTGLQGSLTMVNVPLTLTFSTDMTAIEARDSSTAKAGRGNFVLFPQRDDAVANADDLTSDPMLRSMPLALKSVSGESVAYVPGVGTLPIVKSFLSDFPDLSTPYLTGLTAPIHQAIQWHQVLSVKSIVNDYSSEESILAGTDWVLAMPSRRYSVGLDHRQQTPELVYSSSPTPGGGEYFSVANSSIDRSLVCTKIEDQTFFDRTAQSTTVTNTAGSVKFCGAVPVMTFGVRSALSSSVTSFPANVAFPNGWASINTQNTLSLRLTTERPGLPILGGSFLKATNSAATRGVSGNYGMTFPHTLGR